MQPARLFLHSRPSGPIDTSTVSIDGIDFVTLNISPALLSSTFFSFSFEELYESLGEITSLFIEPDGSFVWRATDSSGQIDGQLTDIHGKLAHVELRIACEASMFEQLLIKFGWSPDCPQGAIVVQDVQRGVLFTPEEFLRFLV